MFFTNVCHETGCLWMIRLVIKALLRVSLRQRIRLRPGSRERSANRWSGSRWSVRTKRERREWERSSSRFRPSPPFTSSSSTMTITSTSMTWSDRESIIIIIIITCSVWDSHVQTHIIYKHRMSVSVWMFGNKTSLFFRHWRLVLYHELCSQCRGWPVQVFVLIVYHQFSCILKSLYVLCVNYKRVALTRGVLTPPLHITVFLLSVCSGKYWI